HTSLQWYEMVGRYFHRMDPEQLTFSMMTRSKRVTYENLKLRDPAYGASVDRWWAGKLAREQGFNLPANPPPPAFTPFRLRDMTLENRLVVSPMCQYSAKDGLVNDWHLVHLGGRAVGGAGLVYAEMTAISAEARITPGCAGIYNDAQATAWKRIVDFVHANSRAKICLQLGHAGRKGATCVPWEGGYDAPLAKGAWPLLAASALPYLAQGQTPKAMDRADMDRTIADYVAAAKRADRAGFDMIEIHMAHGYLLATFLSPLTNRRDDAHGGAIAGRLKFPLEVLAAVRAAWPQGKPIAVRISATDWQEGGLSEDDAVAIAKALKAQGCDLVDVSAGQTTPEARPVYGRMFQTPFSDLVRQEAGVATIAVGNIVDVDQASTIVAAGRADLVAMARPHLADPYFALHAAARADHRGQYWPPQYEAGRDQAYNRAARDRVEAEATREALKPVSHRQAAA
ncbi:MAG: bifunctional salicylyl-CoA 5-hydroxylase/oxidoreductase, partial [Alphaproteobacteria bacterium]|nr:bifunctional salicylyl-CoA 5-hydroxylase/oxidoreductase [Alphaproteobacteria bacterium]